MRQVLPIKQIKSLNFDQLLAMKTTVEAAIDARIGEERRRLTASLQRLDEISSNGKHRGVTRRRNVKHRTLAPKYRNPANPKETWAGRGLKPKWLVAALKGRKKKLSDFAVHH